MRYLIFIACFLPVVVFAQTQKDYEHVMDRFMKFYNTNQGDSINVMFGDVWKSSKNTRPMWTNEENKSLLSEYGNLKSFKYLGIDTKDPNPGLAVFITEYSKAGKKTTSLTLDKDNKLGTFRFITSSDGINELLKKSK